MKMNFFLAAWKKTTIAKKLYFIIGVMTTLVFLQFFVLYFSMKTLSVVRAYVDASGIWSIAQRNAVISLQSYAMTRDEKDFDTFLDHCQIPLGDRVARLELLKDNPDFNIIHKGFSMGKVQESDIGPMIELFRRFKNVSYISHAISLWTTADELFQKFMNAGFSYRAAIQAKDYHAAQNALNEIKRMNLIFNDMDPQFSNKLAEGSRALESTMLTALTILVLLVETVGITLTFITVRSISFRLNLLNQAANRIGSSCKPSPLNFTFNNDEIGYLASSINKMSAMIAESYTNLENRVRARTEELQNSRDQLSVVLNGISDGITVADPAGNFIFANLAGAHIYGLSSVNELLNINQQEALFNIELYDVCLDPYPLDQLPHFLTSLETNKSREVLLQYKYKSGLVKWYLVTSTLIFDKEKNPKFIISIFKDFTEHKRIDDAVKFLDQANIILSSSLNYEAILYSLANLIVQQRYADWCFICFNKKEVSSKLDVITAHRNSHLRKWAKQLFKSFKTEPKDIRKINSVMINGEPETILLMEEDNLSTISNNPEIIEFLQKIKFKSSIMVPIIMRGRVFAVIVLVSSISDRQQIEKDLLMAKEIARRASIAVDNSLLYKNAQNAITSRDEFFSIISHELKTPLTSLSLQIQMSLQKLNPKLNLTIPIEKLIKIFSSSEKQIHRLTRLVDDLLDVSRIQSGNLHYHFSDINISEIVKDSISRLATQLEAANCSLECNIKESVNIHADRERIEQVVENLLTNVIKYAPGGLVQIILDVERDFARFAIIDSGPGIKEEFQNKIFEKFGRVHQENSVSGMGIGLFLVKEIVQAHKGRISLDSMPGMGSKFCIELPIFA